MTRRKRSGLYRTAEELNALYNAVADTHRIITGSIATELIHGADEQFQLVQKAYESCKPSDELRRNTRSIAHAIRECDKYLSRFSWLTILQSNNSV